MCIHHSDSKEFSITKTLNDLFYYLLLPIIIKYNFRCVTLLHVLCVTVLYIELTVRYADIKTVQDDRQPRNTRVRVWPQFSVNLEYFQKRPHRLRSQGQYIRLAGHHRRTDPSSELRADWPSSPPRSGCLFFAAARCQ